MSLPIVTLVRIPDNILLAPLTLLDYRYYNFLLPILIFPAEGIINNNSTYEKYK
jgi:hypothetical protein